MLDVGCRRDGTVGQAWETKPTFEVRALAAVELDVRLVEITWEGAARAAGLRGGEARVLDASAVRRWGSKEIPPVPLRVPGRI